MVTNDNSQVKNKKPRCKVCCKKLSLFTEFECRCKLKFCIKHRHSTQHNCTFDYKQEFKEKLTKENPKIEPKKIDKI